MRPPTYPLRPIIPSNACTPRITAAAGTKLAGASFGGTVSTLGYSPKAFSSRPTELYNPKAFFTHAAWLRQTFVHCARFPTAASRRSLDRVSVPVWLIILSDQLLITGLVSLYLTNYLMRRRLILKQGPLRAPFPEKLSTSLSLYPVLARLSAGYSRL
jgi:hypothetical protein